MKTSADNPSNFQDYKTHSTKQKYTAYGRYWDLIDCIITGQLVLVEAMGRDWLTVIEIISVRAQAEVLKRECVLN